MMTSKLRALLLLAAVAAAGFASGAAAKSWSGGRASAPPDDWRERCSYSGVLQHELGLSAGQRDSLRAIMRRHHPRTRAILAPLRAQLDSLRAEMRAEMRTVLTPAQQERFDSLLARERAERARRDSLRGTDHGARD
jgi:Spy/CpxP family protein refolding chaperone